VCDLGVNVNWLFSGTMVHMWGLISKRRDIIVRETPLQVCKGQSEGYSSDFSVNDHHITYIGKHT